MNIGLVFGVWGNLIHSNRAAARGTGALPRGSRGHVTTGSGLCSRTRARSGRGQRKRNGHTDACPSLGSISLTAFRRAGGLARRFDIRPRLATHGKRSG